jgi:hypothetical protein
LLGFGVLHLLYAGLFPALVDFGQRNSFIQTSFSQEFDRVRKQDVTQAIPKTLYANSLVVTGHLISVSGVAEFCHQGVSKKLILNTFR